MDLSFVKDSKAFSQAVESLRGNTELTEENIKAAYEKIVGAKGKKADAPDAAKQAKADEAAAKKAAKEKEAADKKAAKEAAKAAK